MSNDVKTRLTPLDAPRLPELACVNCHHPLAGTDCFCSHCGHSTLALAAPPSTQEVADSICRMIAAVNTMKDLAIAVGLDPDAPAADVLEQIKNAQTELGDCRKQLSRYIAMHSTSQELIAQLTEQRSGYIDTIRAIAVKGLGYDDPFADGEQKPWPDGLMSEAVADLKMRASVSSDDSRRLDWLEAQGSIEIELQGLGGNNYAVGRDQIDENDTHDTLREAIDAAMSAKATS